ncbi:MAG: GTPase ObgE [Deltaproteobacteria bacterium]|nr:GTPase ObgE [Deltaproteobacteria bacterium]
MKFVDLVRVHVRAGRGGDGAVAWRREKFVPKGGPAGGDGGDGGDVVFVADPHLTTLLDLRYRRHLHAPSGQGGGTHDRNGRAGEDLVVRVPVGTVVVLEREGPVESAGGLDSEMSFEFDEGDLDGDDPDPGDDEPDDDDDGGPYDDAHRGPRVPEPTPVVLGDLSTAGARLVIARGGHGGRGNIHFRTSTNQAPDFAEKGTPGEERSLRLELKLLADIGIVGFPNVGKSTFIAKVSRARPKIADYPFTTLVPQLGVVEMGEARQMVIADVPGLIKGASEGRGLGLQFLRHLERTRVLLHILAPDFDPERDLLADLDALEAELEHYGAVFEGKPRVVALNKLDVLEDEEGSARVEALRAALRERNVPLFAISAHTGAGIPALLAALWRRIEMVRDPAPG